MLDRGVLLAPSQFEALFVSAAHSDADMDATLQSTRESFSSIRSTPQTSEAKVS
jgi:glutamate-1-semialdehyde 2,1-aminomutase